VDHNPVFDEIRPREICDQRRLNRRPATLHCLMRQYQPICQAVKSAANLPRRLCVGILCLSTAVTVQAGEIYKSVDANGNVTYSDHLDPSMPQSTAVQLEDPRFPPNQLHFCWTNCFTLILENGVYRRTDGTDESWTIETFSANGVVLHRHGVPADWNGNSQDVVYAGQVSNDRLINVTVNGKPTSGIDASWGTALNTLPANNAERDAVPTANLPTPSSDAVSSAETPPPVPQEDQPPLTQDGYIWTPGYWYWRNQAYFWTPGAWARPPQLGFLWTPAYWSVNGTVFVFHSGHWGPTVGYYGGVNYGYGYSGNGYTGGHWVGGSFAYNSAVNHVGGVVAHHSYAESIPAQGSRTVASSAQTVSQHQSPPRAATNPATSTAKPSSETSPPPAKVSSPVPVAKTPTPVANTPAPRVPPKNTHATPTRAPPAKP
jgi:hypothetical protein